MAHIRPDPAVQAARSERQDRVQTVKGRISLHANDFGKADVQTMVAPLRATGPNVVTKL